MAKNDSELLSEFFTEIEKFPQFTSRKTNIPGDLRIAWRLSVLCLLLKRGRSNTLSLDHLHVLWWAIRTAKNRELFLRWLNGDRRPDELLVRFDPSLAVTVDLAVGQGLATMANVGSLKLTVSGMAYAQHSNTEGEALRIEREFLGQLPTSITIRQIRNLLEWK